MKQAWFYSDLDTYLRADELYAKAEEDGPDADKFEEEAGELQDSIEVTKYWGCFSAASKEFIDDIICSHKEFVKFLETKKDIISFTTTKEDCIEFVREFFKEYPKGCIDMA